jgi:predicted nucleotidyltransferase
MDREELLKRVKTTVLTFDPHANVILYGSRARGDAAPDSDWDILVLLNIPLDWRLKTAIRNAVYRVELEADEIISTMIHNELDWESPVRRASPIHDAVSREGIAI